MNLPKKGYLFVNPGRVHPTKPRQINIVFNPGASVRVGRVPLCFITDTNRVDSVEETMWMDRNEFGECRMHLSRRTFFQSRGQVFDNDSEIDLDWPGSESDCQSVYSSPEWCD